jgi:methylenetetrahydrofolate reductase (NADPH)
MNVASKLADKIRSGDFIITAEHVPGATANDAATKAALKALGGRPLAVNIADNCRGVAMSSLAASVVAVQSGAEPIFQMVTRDRNRIALQSDLLGAACLGIRNVLCLSGYHQKVMGRAEAGNVFDLDSTQFIETLTRMSEEGVLADGTKIDGPLSVLVGAVGNPFLKPLELNLLSLGKKIAAGARFIQTHAVFDLEAFSQWFEAARREGLTQKAAILASVLPLESAAEARLLREAYTDHCIPDGVVERLKGAGNDDSQKKEGLAICVETIKKLKGMDGLRGIHILSGGKETVVPEILSASGL